MRHLRHILLLLLAVLLLGVAAPASAQDNTDPDDKDALVALYTATDGANWTANTNWTPDQALSTWHGVTTNSDGRVTALVLNNNGLAGTLPAALGDLSELEQLNLEDNALSGLWSDIATGTATTDEAPTIDAVSPGDRSIAVAWTAPTNAALGTVTAYDLRYIRADAPNKADANWTVVSAIWTSGSLEYTLNPTTTPLVNGVSYDVQVRAVVGTDQHPWSGVRSATPRTTPGAPAIDAVTAGARALTAVWSAPASDGGDAITAYDVRHIRSDATDKSDDQWTVVDDAWTSTSGALEYTISALTGNVQYDVQLRGVNAAGDGLWSDTATGSPTTDEAPTIDSVTPGDRTIAVEWTAPTNATLGTVTAYDLRYIRSDAPNRADNNWTVVSAIWTAGSLEYTLNPTTNPLVNGVSYDVQVRAVVGTDQHPWSGVRSATPRTTPGIPAIDTVSPGDRSLTVAWSAPASDGGADITAYDVRHIRSDAADKSDDQWTVVDDAWTDAGGALEYTVSELTVDAQYDVQVRAVNDAGDGLWSATGTGTPRTPPEAPEAVQVYIYVTGKLEVRWSAAESALITGFKVQWRSGDQEWDESRSDEVDPTTAQVEWSSTPDSRRYRLPLDGLRNGTEYEVRVLASNAGVDGNPSTVATGTPQSDSTHDQAATFIENELISVHEDASPWLRVAFDWIDAASTDGDPYGQRSGIEFELGDQFWGRVVHSCFNGAGVKLDDRYWDRWARYCHIIWLYIEWDFVDVIPLITHELAHVLTLTNRLDGAPEVPMAIARLHIARTNIGCEGWLPARELLADLLMVATLGEGAYNRAGYLAGNYCQGDGWRPALEVVRTAGIDGEIPQWLYDTYQDQHGVLDLELLWSHIKAEADTSPVMRDLMRTAFGGLCRSDALWNNAIRIPWRDGGCVPQAPPGLAAVASVDGVMAVSWQSPDNDGGSRITGYTVQWKSGAQEYDTSREASVTALADLSHTIEGLSHGVAYTIRVLATNINGDGAASEVTRTAAGSEAALGTLTLAGVTLYPTFSSTTNSYAAATGHAATQITIAATAADADAGVAFLDGDGNVLTDAGAADGFQVNLSVGPNVIQVEVTAQDGVAATYTVTVTRAEENTSLSPPASDPVPASPSSARYSITFQGRWTTDVTSGGLPGGAHFSPLIGGVHGAGVTFLVRGGAASAGIESMAEVGQTSQLRSEVNAAINASPATALSVLSKSGNIGPTASKTLSNVTLTTDHPRVTLTTMIAPSHDWFVGVSGLPLLNEQGEWLPWIRVFLYPWDAGTEEGNDFSLSPSVDTSPRGVIHSIRGTGKFSAERIANLTFTRTSLSPSFPATESGERSVAENTGSGEDIGNPFQATDSDTGDSVSYSLGGPDAVSFAIVASSGQLRTKAALDYEAKPEYSVTVIATDASSLTAEIEVTITVTDMNEAPTFPSTETGRRSVEELTSQNQPIGDPVVATDPDTPPSGYADLTYRLSGSDAAVFLLDADSGQLQTREPLDYETRQSYQVTVEVRDDPDDPYPDDTIGVTITVINVNEAGMVELPPSTPQEKQALTATLSDLDGLATTSIITWKWERSLDQSTWVEITEAASSGAAMATYTPGAADVGQYLQATAFYTDGHSMGQTASATTTARVQAAPQVSLKLSPSSITEKNGVSTVTAMLDQTSSAETRVTVQVTAGAEAVTPSSNRVLIILANQTTSTGDPVTLTAQDNHVDGPETTEVTVAGPLTHNLLVTAPDPVTLRITDDDARGVTVTPMELTVNEGASNTYAVVLTSEPTAPVTVAVTAPANPDVTVDRTELMFQPGSWNTAQVVKVEAAQDPGADDEAATITHTVSGGDYTTTPALTVDAVAVTVEDDEDVSTAVVLTVNRETVAEGAGRTTVTVTGTLNGAPRMEETAVSVSVTPGTATQGTDFTADPPSFTLTIPADAKSEEASFVLTPQNDRMDEPDETVTVRGNTTVGLTVTPATVTIADNDTPPTVRLAVAAPRIREAGGTITLTAEVSHPSSAETEVTVTELPDVFTLNTNPLTIAPGKTMSSTTLTAVDNDLDARDRRVTVTGVADNAQGVGRVEAAELTITDDDPPEVSGEIDLDYMERETKPVGTYTATNPAGVTLVWSVSGPDAAAFRMDRLDQTRGELRFREAPDFEASRSNVYQVRSNVYQVMVKAADTTSLPGESLPGALDVIVTVQDAPGTVSLPRTPPQIGTPFTATLTDLDGVEAASTAWCWERSLYRDFPPAETHPSHCATSTTAIYIPVNADRDHYLRATATYTDGDGTPHKEAMRGSEALVTDRPPSPPPRPPGGGPPSGGDPPGGSGGGGPTCTDDLHGNTSTQATEITLATPTAGALCPAADVDYFTAPVPGRGLLFVETTGGGQLRGTIWQKGAVLATGPTGSRGQDARLGALVQAGDVVVAVQGQGGATGAYEVVVTLTLGYLENPGAESFQSGVGVLSGWVCEAERVEIELNGVPQEAAYGTERLDTAGVCGDTDNGFGLLFNWNLLRDGEHEVVALVDGVELGRARVTVTTLGQEFVRGVTGTCEAEDFPTLGERVTLVWQQNSQNFVIAGGSPPVGVTTGRTSALTGFLENPGHHSFQSGVGVISGWVCDADMVELEIGHLTPQVAAYGTERVDTLGVCGDVDNGFGLLFNWNLLGDGEHTVVAWVDEEELGRATVRVTTLGQEFLRGAEGECVVEDFPRLGQTVLLEWQQNSQNFVITEVD